MTVWTQIQREKDQSIPVVLFVTSKNKSTKYSNFWLFDRLLGQTDMANHSIVWLFYGLVMSEYSKCRAENLPIPCSRHYIYLILNSVDQENCELTAVGGVRSYCIWQIIRLKRRAKKTWSYCDLTGRLLCFAVPKQSQGMENERSSLHFSRTPALLFKWVHKMQKSQNRLRYIVTVICHNYHGRF